MMSPSPTSCIRLFSSSKIRLTVFLGVVAIAATILASTNSSARSMGQRLFGGVAAIITGGSPGANVAPANTSLASNSEEAAPQGPSSTMTVARRGHTATRLSDGRVLIAGGDNAGGGYLSEAEIFDPATGTFSVTGSMAVGRSDHAAVKLADGKVLLTGGRTATGATNTTEVFDPTTGTFVSGPAMGVARASHTATLLADGRVFVGGGDANGSAEIFDSSSFSAVGANLSTARAKHSAALLLDGRVLIVGGRDSNGADLSSMEVFDPADETFSSAGDLTMARVLPHLRVLFDGKVQIIGGNNDESMEVYDPVTRELGAYAHVVPATDTCTGLRPGILASETRAALFHNGQADALLDRSGHIINELSGSSQALVAGGANSSGIVLDSISLLASSPSSITTDKLDYAPGETVNISGRGWQPGETVRLKIHEDPHTPQERGFDIVADANGSFVGTYLVMDYDLDMKFIVSARGLTSGRNAQTTFTDANPQNVTLSPGSVTVIAGNTANYTATVGVGGNNSACTITMSFAYTGTAPVGTTQTFTPNPLTMTTASVSSALAITTNNSGPIAGRTQPGTYNFTVTAARGANCQGNGNLTTTGTLVVTPANTAPTAASQSVATNEDTPLPITLSGSDADGNSLTFSIVSGPSHGSLGSLGTPSCSGSPSTCTSAVTYTPAANYNGPDSFTFKVNDGTVDSATATVSITVTSVNDAPAGTNKTVATGEDTPYTFAAADFGFTDPNDTPANTLSAVTISTVATDGKLKLNGVDVTAGQSVLVTDINTGKLKFFPDANETGTPYATFTFQVQDNGGTANGGVDLDQSPNTMTVNVDAVNDEPAGTNNTVATNEDTTYTFAAADFGFTDPNDTPANTLSAVKITTVATDGKLKLNGVDVTAGQSVVVADINAGKLKFFPDANENGTPYATFTFQVQDNGGTANGGVDLDQSANTMTVNVNSVNDEPAGANNSATTNEDTAYTFAAAEFGFTDPNDTPANSLAAVKITSLASDGKLKLNGVDVTPGQFIAVADINSGNLKFFPDANESGSTYATFTFQVQDNGGTANGGVDLDQSANTFTLNVTAVNDEPAGTNNTVTTNEDTTYTFTVADFGFTDPNDTPANALAAVKITTVASDGKLKLNGVDVTAGQLILVADITAGNLQFFPDANESGSPYATFTFQVQDDGGTANGGVDLDQSANTMTVNVTAVNDEPAGTDNTVTTNEDTAHTFTAAEFGFTDPNDTPANALAAVKITTIATDGKLKLGGVDVTPGQVILVAAINAGNLKFFPDANESGSPYATFTFQVQDDGGTANGGIDLDQSANTMTINVTAVNDEPAGADNSVTTNEDTPYMFSAAEFGFSDPNDTPANTLAAVKITTIASDGKLKLSGVDVTPGQSILVADITAGNLRFFPDANENGTPYAAFTFQVQDNGGTANGGVDLDQSPNTMTINVTAVNDTPDAVDDSATVDEDSVNNAINVLANDTDPDNLTPPANAGLTVIAVTQGTHGSVTFTAAGVSYTPNANYFGSDSFTYTISDDGTSDPGHTDTATVNVTINNINDAPDAIDDSATVDEDTSNNAINVLANDTDADNLTPPLNAGLTVIAVTQGTHGSVAFTPTGVTYTPAPNYFGTDSFTYTISDDGSSNAGHIDTATVNVTINNINDAPDAIDDSATVDEDTSNNAINVLANDTDADNLTPPFNAGLTVIAVTQGTHGTVAFTASGVTYTPAPNYFGTDSFTYTISDDGSSNAGHIDTATVNVTINNINDAPDAIDDSATVDEDTSNNAINVLANDTDADNLTPPFNAGLTVIAVTQGTHGTVAFTASGVTYTPAPNYFGTDSFTYTISDDGSSNAGHIDTATVNVTINNINDAPDAIDDSATVDEDTSNNAINVLANDTDADNLTPPFNAGLTVIAVTQGTHGTVAFTASGVTYTPAPNYFGTDSFTYTISDDGSSNAGHIDTATVNVTINNVNDTPDAIDDSATVDEDTSNNPINVLANDTDADNLTPPFNAGLTVIAVTQGTHGSVTFTAGGVSYTPAPNYFGTDSFTYTISDDGSSNAGHIDTATVNVTINNINDAPDAVDDLATVDEDTSNNPINVLANDSDADNLTPPFNAGLTVIAVTQGTHGSVTFTAGGVSYTPAPNYFSTDSFTYTISDNGTSDPGHTDTATVNVTINNVNDTPDAINDSATVDEDTSNNPINVLANDSDADNLTPPFNAGLTVIAVTQGTHGSVTFTAGGVSYTPAPNYFGTDSFTYTISDNGTSDPGHTDTATVNVTINNINDAPDAVDDSATVDEDSSNNPINVLANDSDADNLTPPFNAGLTVIAVTQGTHGSVTFTAGGVSYTPAPNYFGTDSFTYTISDNGTSDPGHTDTATVNVTINNVNDTPDAVDDNATVNEDSSNNAIDVLANDTDPDNLTPPLNAGLTVIAVTQGTHGSVTFTAGGVSYTPNANYFGSDSFTYTISDNGTSDAGHTDTATVNVTINNVNDTPDAVNDSATVSEDSSNNAVNVLANDTDADNLTPPFNAGLTVISVTQGAHGTVTFTAGGVSYTPAPNYFGPDSFTYTISDNGTNTAGHTDTATVNVTVTNVNDAPIINTLTIAPGVINENDSAALNGSFSDEDGSDPHTVVISWGDGSPNTTINLAAGVFTFTANHQYKDDNPTATAADVNTVMVSVCDGGPDGNPSTSGDNACAGRNTTITVRNLAPVIISANGPTTPQPAGSSITVTANFTDVGTKDTHVCSVNWDDGTTSNGTVTEVNGSGTCTASHTYTTAGVYSVVITVTDDDTGSASRGIELQYVVIFDPGAGFITGGGWIMSPAGACQLTPGCVTSTGKANFGFVSKYKKGSNTPDGQTEFQFQAGDINFHSSEYDYGSLVVSGFKAQYRGTGEINGVPGYKFVLTAYDGDVNGGGGIDKFRMKITKNGVVVYDNRVGASDDLDLANPLAISGGSIVIHK